MPIKVLVNGAFGRMGQIVVKTMKDHHEFELVGQTGREYDLVKSIQDSQAAIVIDFTHPDAVFNNTLMIIDAGAHPVIGTSGLTIEQVKELQNKSRQLKRGGIIAPNFSLGAVLMMKYAKEIANYMPNFEIIEMHHANKIDSPSGTAVKSAEMLATDSNKKNTNTYREVIPGARGAAYKNTNIHSVRLPGLLAHQQIIFGSVGETLTLKHDSIDRECFMSGVCLACKKVLALDHLVYGLDEIL
jgi:4-hydroxy-tetrahydrodipicolinate reductase